MSQAADGKEEDCDGQLQVGNRVRLHALQAKPEHNGKAGKLVAWDAGSGRWTVALDGGGSLRVKAANLAPAAVSQAAEGKAASGRTPVRPIVT